MHKTFVNFMSAMIVLNVVVMAFVSADMSDEFTDFLELLNDIFTWLFFAEAAIKRAACLNIIDGTPFSQAIARPRRAAREVPTIADASAPRARGDGRQPLARRPNP